MWRLCSLKEKGLEKGTGQSAKNHYELSRVYLCGPELITCHLNISHMGEMSSDFQTMKCIGILEIQFNGRFPFNAS